MPVNSGNGTGQARPRRILEAGQGLAEYVLIVALVAVLAIGAMVYVGGMGSGALSNVADVLNGAAPNGSSAGPQPTPVPAANYSTKKACTAAGYTWIARTTKNHETTPAHCQ